MTWPKAMGLKACVLAVRFIKRVVTGCTLVVDPFCGKGSVLAVANEFGLDSLGVEISTKRSKDALLLRTTALQLEKEENRKLNKERQRKGDMGHPPGKAEATEVLALREQGDDEETGGGLPEE